MKQFILQSFSNLFLNNESHLAAKIRSRLYGTDCFIDTAVVIKNRRNFEAASHCALYHGTYILNSKGSFKMGSRSHLGAFCFVNACYGKVEIGDDVAIGPGTKIFSYSNHYEDGKKVTESKMTKDVSIGNNVFIGANCSIFPGTVIEDDVVIGAGSVIKGRVEAGGVYAGSPCRKIKDRAGKVNESAF